MRKIEIKRVRERERDNKIDWKTIVNHIFIPASKSNGSNLLTVVMVGVRILEPLLQQRLQLAHVLEGEVQRLEPGDGRLGEIVAVQFAHGQAHVALRITCEQNRLFVKFEVFYREMNRGKK